MKKLAFLFAIITLSLNSFAQNNQQPSPLSPTVWGVVYDVPATKNVRVKTDVPYSGNLTIDVYTPPDAKAGDKFPAVVFLNAIGDNHGNKVKNWEIYKSFPRLVAAHGLVGISMEADGSRIQENLRSLFEFLEKDGAKHGVDGSRLGVYAASANVAQSAIFLMNERAPKSIKAAALYYGGAPTMMPRKDLPVLFILAEGDMQAFGASIPALWQRIAETRAPWTLQMASNLPHAFDAFEDTDDARRIIQQTIAFWKSHLEPVPQPAWKPSEERAIVAATYWNDANKSVPLLQKYIAAHPNDGEAFNQYGRALAQLRRFDEAGAAYEKAFALGVRHGGIYNGLGQTRMAQKRWAEAADYLAKAVELGARNSFVYGQLAFVQMNLNQNEEAIKTYEKAFAAGIPPGANTRGAAFYNMACAYARLKQNDKAFEMLSKAVDEGFNNRQTLENDSDLASLRSDARFQEILKRLPKS